MVGDTGLQLWLRTSAEILENLICQLDMSQASGLELVALVGHMKYVDDLLLRFRVHQEFALIDDLREWLPAFELLCSHLDLLIA